MGAYDRDLQFIHHAIMTNCLVGDIGNEVVLLNKLSLLYTIADQEMLKIRNGCEQKKIISDFVHSVNDNNLKLVWYDRCHDVRSFVSADNNAFDKQIRKIRLPSDMGVLFCRMRPVEDI